jgi:phage-related protein
MTDILANNKDLQHARIVRKRTFAKFLDDDNFDGGNPWGEADSSAEISNDTYIVAQKTAENKLFVELELTTALDVDGAHLNNRVILSNYCSFHYRGHGCRYEGAELFDKDNNKLNVSNTSLINYLIQDQYNLLEWANGTFYKVGDMVWSVNRRVNLTENYLKKTAKFQETYYVCSKNHTANQNTAPWSSSGPVYWKKDECSKNISACKKRFNKTPINTNISDVYSIEEKYLNTSGLASSSASPSTNGLKFLQQEDSLTSYIDNDFTIAAWISAPTSLSNDTHTVFSTIKTGAYWGGSLLYYLHNKKFVQVFSTVNQGNSYSPRFEEIGSLNQVGYDGNGYYLNSAYGVYEGSTNSINLSQISIGQVKELLFFNQEVGSWKVGDFIKGYYKNHSIEGIITEINSSRNYSTKLEGYNIQAGVGIINKNSITKQINTTNFQAKHRPLFPDYETADNTLIKVKIRVTANSSPTTDTTRRFEVVEKPAFIYWAAASTEAQSLGGRLAVLNTQEKNNIVPTFNGHKWIGGHDVTKEGTFRWINGEYVKQGYQNWEFIDASINPNFREPNDGFITAGVAGLTIFQFPYGGISPGTYNNLQSIYQGGPAADAYPVLNITIGSGGNLTSVNVVSPGSGFVSTGTLIGVVVGGKMVLFTVSQLTTGVRLVPQPGQDYMKMYGNDVFSTPGIASYKKWDDLQEGNFANGYIIEYPWMFENQADIKVSDLKWIVTPNDIAVGVDTYNLLLMEGKNTQSAGGSIKISLINPAGEGSSVYTLAANEKFTFSHFLHQKNHDKNPGDPDYSTKFRLGVTDWWYSSTLSSDNYGINRNGFNAPRGKQIISQFDEFLNSVNFTNLNVGEGDWSIESPAFRKSHHPSINFNSWKVGDYIEYEYTHDDIKLGGEITNISISGDNVFITLKIIYRSTNVTNTTPTSEVVVKSTDLTWPQAKADAELRGGRLFCPKIKEDWDNVYYANQALMNINSCWIGGTDTGKEGDWRWIDETLFYTGVATLGGAVSGLFNNWSAGEPSNFITAGGQHYAYSLAFNSSFVGPNGKGAWDDAHLPFTLKSYILERPVKVKVYTNITTADIRGDSYTSPINYHGLAIWNRALTDTEKQWLKRDLPNDLFSAPNAKLPRKIIEIPLDGRAGLNITGNLIGWWQDYYTGILPEKGGTYKWINESGKWPNGDLKREISITGIGNTNLISTYTTSINRNYNYTKKPNYYLPFGGFPGTYGYGYGN